MEFQYRLNKKERIKDFLIKKKYSRNMINKIKDSIYLNNKVVKLWQNGFKNDILRVSLPAESSEIIPRKNDINIVYEDDYLLIVDKPRNMYTMPVNKNFEESLANYLLFYFNEKGLGITIHLVNRLDKDTSGLVLVAKHQLIHALFIGVKIVKRYYAVLEGKIKRKGKLVFPIAKSLGIKREVAENGKYARTDYKLIKFLNNKSLVDIGLKTGRTHQIRVHFSHIGFPIVGDSLYGVGDELALQSYFISFNHPVTNKKIKIEISNRLKEVLHD